MEGGLGVNRHLAPFDVYLSPSMTSSQGQARLARFRGGADLYPRIANRPAARWRRPNFYFRPPGTTGSEDVLIERDILRGFDGERACEQRYEHHYGAYFQDRWKPS